MRLDSNTYSVPPQHVGRTVTVRADDARVRVLRDGVEIAAHLRSWDRHDHVEAPAHVDDLLSQRKAARGPKRRARLLDACPHAQLYLNEVARRRIHLSHEIEKLLRLLDIYGPADLSAAITRAIAQKTFGARFVRALCDQARFAQGLGEPPEPIVTGNTLADQVVVEPHPMESYDALFRHIPSED